MDDPGRPHGGGHSGDGGVGLRGGRHCPAGARQAASVLLWRLRPPQKLGSPGSGLMQNAAISAKPELLSAVWGAQGETGCPLFASLGSKLPLLRLDFPASDSALPVTCSASKDFFTLQVAWPWLCP